MKYFAIVAAIAFAMPAFAQDAAPADAAPAPRPVVQPTETLVADFNAVCASQFVLSDKAKTACETKQLPRASGKGETFRNVGIGVEFNTLIRNLN